MPARPEINILEDKRLVVPLRRIERKSKDDLLATTPLVSEECGREAVAEEPNSTVYTR